MKNLTALKIMNSPVVEVRPDAPLSLALALIAPHLCPAWLALIVFAVVRQISDTKVRLLGNLVLQVKPRALLGALDEQHKVCRLNWPLASAYSFQPLTVAL